jgi:hypothetical protein
MNSSGYVLWCVEKGYVNDEGEVVSLDHVIEYMKTEYYAQEHDEQERKINREYNNETRPHN